jgi:hypothetical protein
MLLLRKGERKTPLDETLLCFQRARDADEGEIFNRFCHNLIISFFFPLFDFPSMRTFINIQFG